MKSKMKKMKPFEVFLLLVIAFQALLVLSTFTGCGLAPKTTAAIDKISAAAFCPVNETVVSIFRGPLAYEVECSGGSIVSVDYR